MEENRLDLGLVTLPANGRCLAVTPILDEEFVFIFASDGLPPTRLTPDVLQALPLIAFEAGSGTRALIDGWFHAAGLTIAPVMQLGSIEAIKRMVRAGAGLQHRAAYGGGRRRGSSRAKRSLADAIPSSPAWRGDASG
ncbi:HTH-type transcriptional activator CmpR [Raoultella terrigena]|uniref:HTH-type transcriptional activator CmpR n=1 Tax=Raoultella terrigena TaxID=577 RepID=A0A3P8KGZ8_RAOTE|nr:HTH-type transcriptional activator CmpR [Raoultella terrigena]